MTAGALRLEGDSVRIPGLTVAVAGGSLRLEGLVPIAAFWPEARRDPEGLAPEEKARLAMEWSGIEAGTLMRWLAPEKNPAVEAMLAGRAELHAGLASLAELRGTLTLPATTARVEDLILDLAPSEVRRDSGRLSTESLEFRAGAAALRLAGSLDLPSRAVDISGKGTLDLRALSPFLAEAALTGTSVVDLRVRGKLDSLKPEGTVRVTGGTLRLRELPQAITGLAAEIVLDGSMLRLQSSSAALGGGTLSASGSARLEGTGLSGLSFALTGRNLALRYPEGMRSRLEADLTLTGDTGAFRLAGTVRALRGLYDLDTALEESLKARHQKAPIPLCCVRLRSISLW